MNWFGKILNLPKEFLNESEGPGGGILQVDTCLLKMIVYYFYLNLYIMLIIFIIN